MRPHWREIDRELRRIARRRAEVDADEARWLLAAYRGGVHRELGHATFVEYIERVLGYGPRTTLDRLRVAESLETLPATARALMTGALAYSAVRELTRVATPPTEAAWLDAAQGKTVRQIEELVSGHEPGELPDDPARPDLRPQVLRFEVSPETRALLRDAERRLAIEHGHMLDDDELIAAMCRAVLAPTWARAGVHAAADVRENMGEHAASAASASAGAPRYQIAVNLCPACERASQDGGGRAIDIGPEAIETARCDAQIIARGRATRTIPPATRRAVMRRDHGRCVVAGCRSTRWIDVHHLLPRAEGGRHDVENLACLCAAHHRAVHDGRLRITGQPGAFAFFLRSMGYASGEAATAIERARAHVGANDGAEAWIRAALRAALPATSASVEHAPT